MNPYCAKHEWPAGMGKPCPDCEELNALKLQNSDLKTVLRGLVEQVVADARSTGPFKITSSQALKEAMTFAWRALEIHEKGSTPQTGTAPRCNACGAVVYVRVKELEDANRLNGEYREALGAILDQGCRCHLASCVCGFDIADKALAKRPKGPCNCYAIEGRAHLTDCPQYVKR